MKKALKRESLKKKKKRKVNQPLSPSKACKDDWELHSSAWKFSSSEQHTWKRPWKLRT